MFVNYGMYKCTLYDCLPNHLKTIYSPLLSALLKEMHGPSLLGLHEKEIGQNFVVLNSYRVVSSPQEFLIVTWGRESLFGFKQIEIR